MYIKMANRQRGLLLSRHARVLTPYPPQCGGGALGVSGIQICYWQRLWIPAYYTRE